jgi:hypothetical protein
VDAVDIVDASDVVTTGGGLDAAGRLTDERQAAYWNSLVLRTG